MKTSRWWTAATGARVLLRTDIGPRAGKLPFGEARRRCEVRSWMVRSPSSHVFNSHPYQERGLNFAWLSPRGLCDDGVLDSFSTVAPVEIARRRVRGGSKRVSMIAGPRN